MNVNEYSAFEKELLDQDIQEFARDFAWNDLSEAKREMYLSDATKVVTRAMSFDDEC
jgi:hypothetical protein